MTRHPEALTAAQMGVTTAPNRTLGARQPEPMPRAALTGDVLLDRCRGIAETANLVGHLRLGARWHELADRVAADLPGARAEADAALARLGTPRKRPADLDDRLRMELGR